MPEAQHMNGVAQGAPSSKSDFIRQNKALGPAQIVTLPEAQKLKITRKYAEHVLYRDRQNKAHASKAQASKPKKSKTSKPHKTTLLLPPRLAFVQRHPNKPAAEVARIAIAAGFPKMNAQNVWIARYELKKRAAKHLLPPPTQTQNAPHKNKAPALPAIPPLELMAREEALKGLAAAIGLPRAIEVLQEEARRLQKMLGALGEFGQ